MRIGVVIPVGPGREHNLRRVLDCLAMQIPHVPARICVVEDGEALPSDFSFTEGTLRARRPKHEPGQEQPRNYGVRALMAHDPLISHVWFLDSDIVVEPDCLEAFETGMAQGDERRILVGPYDWLRDGEVPLPGWMPQLHDVRNDPRWQTFDTSMPADTYVNDLSAGLGCFSGNLVWPVTDFMHVGGFWNELHHGRCEDGELGLRAVAMDVPISYVPDARGWHVAHPINMAWALTANRRDVPMLNDRHPWVQQAGIELNLDRDGAAFDVRCPGCGTAVPTIRWWAHAPTCGVIPAIPGPRGEE